MRPEKKDQEADQAELFRSRLSSILDHKHPLYMLAEAIDWETLEREFGALYVENVGRPGLATRLHYLKHLCDQSDERVVEGFIENPYWQYFCGMEFFVHELPCDPTSLVKWRHRIGAEGMEKLLGQTIEAAQRKGALKPSEIKRVNVDTTVQEKAIAFPTDARLYHKARRTLVREARRAGIVLRQSYERVGKRALQKQGRYAHANQGQRARKETRKLKVYLGRVIRDIRRKAEAGGVELSQRLDQFSKRWRSAIGEKFNSLQLSTLQPRRHEIYTELKLAFFRDDYLWEWRRIRDYDRARTKLISDRGLPLRGQNFAYRFVSSQGPLIR